MLNREEGLVTKSVGGAGVIREENVMERQFSISNSDHFRGELRERLGSEIGYLYDWICVQGKHSW